jgi:hypothetical protein
LNIAIRLGVVAKVRLTTITGRLVEKLGLETIVACLTKLLVAGLFNIITTTLWEVSILFLIFLDVSKQF